MNPFTVRSSPWAAKRQLRQLRQMRQMRQSVQPLVSVPEYLSTVQGIPPPACTYTLEVREHHHSLTTYHLGLDTLAELVRTVGRQFAVEMAGLPAAERHELEIRITPEPLRMPQEAR